MKPKIRFSFRDRIQEKLLKLISNKRFPAKWFYPSLKSVEFPQNKTNPPIILEIVTHCWNYSHLLAYQLSSLVQYPPINLSVIVTVFYNERDAGTSKLLNDYSGLRINNLHWNIHPLPTEQLFRRSIGRNIAAKNSKADWIWFTDCDVIFHQNCLGSISEQLTNTCSPLVFPNIEYRSIPLSAEDDMLTSTHDNPGESKIDREKFIATKISKATGPLQIVNGEVARKLGYCELTKLYQKTVPSWQKATEDRVFRWLLGTQGEGLDIKDVYRIQHQEKGRYKKNSALSAIRKLFQNIKMTWWKTNNQ